MTPPILDEIRRVWHAMSVEIQHDPQRIVEYFSAIQRNLSEPVINLADQGPLGRTKPFPEENQQTTPEIGSSQSLRLQLLDASIRGIFGEWNPQKAPFELFKNIGKT